jgi:hypothetical protein
VTEATITWLSFELTIVHSRRNHNCASPQNKGRLSLSLSAGYDYRTMDVAEGSARPRVLIVAATSSVLLLFLAWAGWRVAQTSKPYTGVTITNESPEDFEGISSHGAFLIDSPSLIRELAADFPQLESAQSALAPSGWTASVSLEFQRNGVSSAKVYIGDTYRYWTVEGAKGDYKLPPGFSDRISEVIRAQREINSHARH